MRTASLVTAQLVTGTALIAAHAHADAGHDSSHHAINQKTAIVSDAGSAKLAAFDILAAHVHIDGRTATFHMTTNGLAGAERPDSAGDLGGAPVYAYVWPTSLDPAEVGFEAGSGILAMVATSHPDFDDTPLFDENADGDPANDGGVWHSHWVVLHGEERCGPDALAVRDIPQGANPDLPATWPGLPIFIDSPGYTPLFDGPEITVNVPFADSASVHGMAYDGVTSALRVNANIHAPLLCVTDVFDIASGDLSLPGTVE
ncbi:MAG: hypothetical protein ACFB3T_10765 [Geminicoccaceae bacterium]